MALQLASVSPTLFLHPAAVEALVGEAYAQEVFVATALLRSCLVTGAYVALGTGRPRDAVAMCREAMGLSDGYPQVCDLSDLSYAIPQACEST